MQSKDEIITKTKKLLTNIIEAEGLELYDVEYLTEHGQKILRLYIDKEGGVNLNDCEAINNLVIPSLDADDPIPEAYILEVSSPGIERKLVKPTHYTKNIGTKVEVRLHAPLNENIRQKKLQGTLLNYKEDVVTISYDKGEVLEIPIKNVKVCRLVYEA